MDPTEPGRLDDGAPERLGDFRLLERLGGGGMGAVYLAEQVSLRRRVALKLIHPHQLHRPEARGRFRREVEAVAQLSHKAIVPVFVHGEEEGLPYFAMEWIDGASLADILIGFDGRRPESLTGLDLRASLRARERSPSDRIDRAPPLFHGGWVETCLSIAREVADALDHAHSHEILHRDLKPSNIMVTPDGEVRLLDFGLATWKDGMGLTGTGVEVGSLPYLAPEQLRAKPASPRSDVYALGVTLYELLTLRPPFLADSELATRRRILDADAQVPRVLNPGVSWDAETVCMAAMDPEPDRRYASAGAFARDLDRALTLRAIEARRPSPLRRMRRWSQRHPARAVALGLGLLVVLCASPAFAIMQGRATERVNAALARETALNRDLSGVKSRLEASLATAARERSRAESRLDSLTQLSDLKRVRDLEREAEQLWPARPEKLDALRSWLSRAQDMEKRLEPHRAMLASLRAGESAVPSSEADLPGLDWWRETLGQLVNELAHLCDRENGTIASVHDRVRRAESIRQESLGDFEEDWQAAIDAISADAQYDGLAMSPQIGLVPIGRDRDSGLWEFWHVESGHRPERDPQTGKLSITGDSGIVLVLVPGGSLFLGDQKRDRNAPNYNPRSRQEEGVHQVKLDPFFISKYEVTQAQWFRLTGDRPSYFGLNHEHTHGLADLHPVEQVSFDECVTALMHVGLLLPTEAQWEWSARGGRGRFWIGADVKALAVLANLADRQYFAHFPAANAGVDWDDGYPRTLRWDPSHPTASACTRCSATSPSGVATATLPL
jgi:serine/threonine protein kinase